MLLGNRSAFRLLLENLYNISFPGVASNCQGHTRYYSRNSCALCRPPDLQGPPLEPSKNGHLPLFAKGTALSSLLPPSHFSAHLEHFLVIQRHSLLFLHLLFPPYIFLCFPFLLPLPSCTHEGVAGAEKHTQMQTEQ